MALNLPHKIKGFLAERPLQKFAAREIAKWIFANFRDECEKKMAASDVINTKADLMQQIVAEIGSQRPTMQKHNPQIRTTEGRPRLYYWDATTDQDEVTEVDEADIDVMEASEGSPIKESNLYPLLSNYLWNEYKIYPLRIDEKKSSNTKGPKGNSWLYPDLVGMENLQDGWHQEIKSAAKESLGKRIRLWSFEVKTRLKRSNVRQAFFRRCQTRLGQILAIWSQIPSRATARWKNCECLLHCMVSDSSISTPRTHMKAKS